MPNVFNSSSLSVESSKSSCTRQHQTNIFIDPSTKHSRQTKLTVRQYNHKLRVKVKVRLIYVVLVDKQKTKNTFLLENMLQKFLETDFWTTGPLNIRFISKHQLIIPVTAKEVFSLKNVKEVVRTLGACPELSIKFGLARAPMKPERPGSSGLRGWTSAVLAWIVSMLLTRKSRKAMSGGFWDHQKHCSPFNLLPTCLLFSCSNGCQPVSTSRGAVTAVLLHTLLFIHVHSTLICIFNQSDNHRATESLMKPRRNQPTRSAVKCISGTVRQRLLSFGCGPHVSLYMLKLSIFLVGKAKKQPTIYIYI